MGLKLVTPPATKPITLAEGKQQCSIVDADTSFDTLIQAYIDAATAHFDGLHSVTGICLEPQTWELYLDAFTDAIRLPLGPVIEVEEVAYIDEDGNEQPLSAETYTVDLFSPTAWIVLNSDASWPTVMSGINTVRIRFTAGHEDGTPEPIKQAIRLLVGLYFNSREAVVIGQTATELPLAVKSLIGPYRKMAV